MISGQYKAALVTGAARRIGRHLALDLAKNGVAIAVHHNGSDTEAQAVVETIEAGGGTAICIQADLSSVEETTRLVEDATTQIGLPLDILVNNASVFQQDSLSSLTADSWALHHNVNLRAPVLLTQAFAAQVPAGSPAAVINIIDQRVLKLNPQYMSYTAAKAGLLAVTKTMAQDLAHKHIRVNGIGPGPTLPNDHQTEAEFTAEASSVPLGAGPSLDEITAGVRFLLETPSMTGQMIALDGGQHLAWRTKDILED